MTQTQFRIFKHPDGRLQAVKVGWCWPAFFFGAIWALVTRLWVVAIAMIAILLILIGWGLIGIGAVIIMRVIYGVCWNKWREMSLLSKHFTQEEIIIEANDNAEALAMYVKNFAGAQTNFTLEYL
jgi:predicted tellurium resistance membrane protein TerC